MKDKHYLYRVAVTCYVDSLFYETGNARRCHDRCHSLITQTLCGIGKSTCRNYLRYDRSELLAEVRIPPALKELLHLYVLTGHEMSANADGSSSARTPPAAGNRTPPCGPAGIGAHRRFADRMASQGTEGSLPAEIRLRPPIRGAEPQPAAPDPSRRPAAHTKAKTA